MFWIKEVLLEVLNWIVWGSEEVLKAWIDSGGIWWCFEYCLKQDQNKNETSKQTPTKQKNKKPISKTGKNFSI